MACYRQPRFNFRGAACGRKADPGIETALIVRTLLAAELAPGHGTGQTCDDASVVSLGPVLLASLRGAVKRWLRLRVSIAHD